MVKIMGSMRGLFLLSCLISLLTGVAILGFGAPPVILVAVAWGGALFISAMRDRVERHLGRR